MGKSTRRGYVQGDEKSFTGKEVLTLNKASKDLRYLLDAGYAVKSASTFVGNHYLLSERQRVALTRMVSSSESVRLRKGKLLVNLDNVREVNIDGFNTVITLEVGLSSALVLRCMDGTIRDLAGLRGTYHIIDKTELAIRMIFQWLDQKHIKKATIFLDAPVSNSGRLKVFIFKISEEYNVEIQVEVIHDVDRVLEQRENVITSDAIILDHCKSWINMNGELLTNLKEKVWMLNL